MLSKLTQQRKILLGITAVTFIVAATLITQTYFTMQIYNAADAICTAAPKGMSKDELYRLAESKQTPITFMINSDTTTQARMGFASTSKETCGCLISLEKNKVTEVGDTFCQSY
ncbi:MAG: hypothetical protein V3R49_03565 [Gammaproteobacteria bacterium]